MAWATKDPARTRVGPNLHSLQHSAGAHDCKYLVLPRAERFLQTSVFLPLPPSVRSACSLSVFARVGLPSHAVGNAPYPGLLLWDLGCCGFPEFG